MRRIQSLDGLRAISILLVTLSHILPLVVSHRMDQVVLIPMGQMGVDVFFVISGFLITTLMIKEWDKSGTVSLKGFYRRRVLRIFPAYIFFLLVVFAFTRLGLLQVQSELWPKILTYTYNLTRHSAHPVVGQIWSLCIEEHFYLLWPFAFIALGRKRAPIALWFALGLALVLRVLFHGSRTIDIDSFTLTRLDTLGIGCLLAFHYGSGLLVRLRGQRMALIAALFLLISVYGLSISGKYQILLKRPLEAALIAVIIASLVQDANGLVGRFLNWRPVVWIGLLSYSLYLGQTMVTSGLLPLALRIPALLAYAMFSYYLIESPLLKRKTPLLHHAPSSADVLPVHSSSSSRTAAITDRHRDIRAVPGVAVSVGDDAG